MSANVVFLPGVSVEQADVVGRRAHARPVQPRGCHGPGVASAELGRQHVDLLQRQRHPAQLHGQRVGGIVARVHQQPVQQLVDGVGATRGNADPGALRAGILRRAVDGLVEVELAQRCHRNEHLDDTGRAVTTMRVTRGDNGAAVQVGDHPGLGGDVARHWRSVGRGDDTAAVQCVTADRLGRHRQRQRWIPGLRDFRRVHRGRSRHLVRTHVMHDGGLGERGGHAEHRGCRQHETCRCQARCAA